VVRGSSKVGIVGAGSVGATVAYACQVRGVATELALYDVDERKMRAEVLDLNHGLQFTPVASVVGGGLEALAGADVVVVTAGAKQHPGQSRLDLAATNVAMARDLVPRLLEVAPDAVVLVVTNPCDVVTYAALRSAGLPPGRVLGSGTVLDSSRLRYLVAQRCGVAVPSVHAYVLGEHGDSEVAVWSGARIGGQPLERCAPPGTGPLDRAERERIAEEVVRAAYDIIAGKGATWYAVALAVAQIVEAVLGDENRVLPVSTLLQGWHGIDDVCLSVPCVVGRSGVTRVLEVPLAEDELAGMRRSADSVRSVARSLGV
jgi:L-lactate dehydrogenase